MDYRSTVRLTVLLTAFFAALVVFCVRLYSVQVTKTEETVSTTENYEFLFTVPAARGNILDRNGKMLISNRASYNVSVTNFIIYSQEDTNANILALVNKCEEYGIEHVDHLPVSKEAPYDTMILDEMSAIWQNRFKTFMAQHDWDVDLTAASLMRLLRKSYSIPNDWSDDDARLVIGVRYELELRSYDYSLSNYLLCSDVPSDALAAISELNIPGVSVEISTVREYDTTYAAHILGTVGKMTAEEWEEYEPLGYSMDAVVGKDGFELAFESYLHGTDGLKRVVISPTGETVAEYYETEPVTGNNVETTLDLDLQIVAENALSSYIQSLNAAGLASTDDRDNTGTGTDAEGGAVVVIDPRNGEVLACASYPTFDLSTYNEDFEELLADELNPLYNRALQAIYNPGSTYKPVTAITAVDFAGVNPYAQIEDLGIFSDYEDTGFAPMCMYYRHWQITHGWLDMTRALCVSCNYYFYVMGDKIFRLSDGTNEPIDETASKLGLGEYTGIELPESKGYRCNPETKKELYADGENGFYVADAVLGAIGQSDNKFTVIQLATYCAALANRGTRYRTTFLQRVVSPDYSEIIKDVEPEVSAQLEASDLAWEAVFTGMRMVASDTTEGTAKKTFGDYSIKVCAKTGTAEQDTGGSSHAAFICYAPADDPQIAIAIYVEKGASGANLGPIARTILDAYFYSEDEDAEYIVAEGIPK